MTFSIRVERIGAAGIAAGDALLFEANSEVEAVALAAYKVDAHRSWQRRLATAFDASGSLMLAYADRARDRSDAIRG